MGLFDKLRDVADVAKNSLDKAVSAANQAVEAAQSAADPFSDPVVKQYYEIVCGFYETFLPKTRIDDSNLMAYSQVEKYVEYHLNEACDEVALNKTLELYSLCCADYAKNKNNKTYIAVTHLRSETRKAGLYQMNTYEAYKMFFKEEIDAATEEYKKIIDVIKDNPNHNTFAQGLAKLSCTNQIKQIVVANSFLAGDTTTQTCIVACVLNNLIRRWSVGTHVLGSLDAKMLALRALHFEEQGGDAENYTALTEDDYRNFVLRISAYKEDIDNHPFDTEEYITKYVNFIKDADVFGCKSGSISAQAFFIDSVDEYYSDAVCHFVWKIITASRNWTLHGETVNQTKDPDIMTTIILAYVEELASD